MKLFSYLVLWIVSAGIMRFLYAQDAPDLSATAQMPSIQYTVCFQLLLNGKVIGIRQEMWAVFTSTSKEELAGGGVKYRVGSIREQEKHEIGGALTESRSELHVKETANGEFLALEEIVYEGAAVTRLQVKYSPSEHAVYFTNPGATEPRVEKVDIPEECRNLPLFLDPSTKTLKLRDKLALGESLVGLALYPHLNGFGVVKIAVIGRHAEQEKTGATWLVSVSDASGPNYQPSEQAGSPVLYKADSDGVVIEYGDGAIKRIRVPPSECRMPESLPTFANTIPLIAAKDAVPRGLELLYSEKIILALRSTDALPQLPNCRYQTVEQSAPTEALVVLNAFRPDTARAYPEALSGEERARYLESTNEIQADHPVLREMAYLETKSKTGDAPTMIDAMRLAYYVSEHIRGMRVGNSGQTALDVYYSKAGDCTEYSLLLTALLRARGIPARRIAGMVIDGGKLTFHAWVECYMDGRWIGIDPTLKRFGLPACYIYLGDLDGPDAARAGELVFQLANSAVATYITRVDGRQYIIKHTETKGGKQ